MSITIAEVPVLAGSGGKLVVPESLEFPTVFPGELASAELEVHNIGTGSADGTLALPAGWSTEGSTRYRIPAGGRLTFNIAFTATKAGNFQDDAIFNSPPKRIVPLHIVVESPLVIKPAALKLAPAPGQATRSAMFLLENRTQEPQVVRLSAGPRLVLPEPVQMGAKETAQVLIAADESELGEFADKIKLESGTWSAELPVRVAAVGAIVSFAKPPEFGAVIAGTPASAEVLLRNTGAQLSIVVLSADGAFSVENGTITVPPRSEARARVFLREPKAGVNIGKLTASCVNESLALSVTASEPAKTEHKPAPAAVEEPEESTDSLPGFRGRAEKPNGLGDFARDIQPTSVVLEWPAELGPQTALRVEARVLSLGSSDDLVTSWLPLGAVTFQSAGSQQRAVVQRLKPATVQALRVLSGDKVLFTSQFVTPAKKPWIELGWQGVTLIAFALGLLGVGWHRWKTRERSAW